MIYTDEEVRQLRAETEAQRRERPTLNAAPLKDRPDLRDYAASGTMIQNAMHHLDESIPSGQRQRTELAMNLLVAGAMDLNEWLKAKGHTEVPNFVDNDEGAAAIKTLRNLGFTYNEGAELWKPPVHNPAKSWMPDHVLRQLVGRLTEEAREFGQTQQLRERIQGVVFAYLGQAGKFPSAPDPLPTHAPATGYYAVADSAEPVWLKAGELIPTPDRVLRKRSQRDIELANAATHDLYTDKDADRPEVICDGNGQVALSLCKRCGAGEAELLERPCAGALESGEPTRGYIAQAEEPSADAYRHYVLGFLFNHAKSRVVLIRKQRGMPHLVGRLNGLGGQVQFGESVEEAMSRECLEECGLLVRPEEWRNVGPLQFAAQRMGFLLTAEVEDVALDRVTASSEGSVFALSVANVLSGHLHDCMANLNWMIGLCLDPEQPKFLGVDYSATRVPA